MRRSCFFDTADLDDSSGWTCGLVVFTDSPDVVVFSDYLNAVVLLDYLDVVNICNWDLAINLISTKSKKEKEVFL